MTQPRLDREKGRVGPESAGWARFQRNLIFELFKIIEI
jgi:hypothetical protein